MPTTSLSRRSFLKLSGAAGLSLAGAASLPAIEPFRRTGAPRLLLSLAAYSFRDFFKHQRGNAKPKAEPAKQIDMLQFVDYCAEQGCDGAELTSYFVPPDTDEAYLIRLRRHAFLRGIAISGSAVGNNFTHPAGEKRDAEIAGVKQWIDRSALLGAPHIRVFAGQYKDLAKDVVERNVLAALEQVCDYAGKKGIFLGLENHDSIGNAKDLLSLVRAVQSPWLGVNLDTGNFRTADPYRDMEETLPYAVNVQLKAELRRSDAKEAEPIDLPRAVKLIKQSNYQGYVALEYEAKEDPYSAIPPLLKQMKQAFAA
jgi:sugar phosphate isomerase/epimerase